MCVSISVDGRAAGGQVPAQSVDEVPFVRRLVHPTHFRRCSARRGLSRRKRVPGGQRRVRCSAIRPPSAGSSSKPAARASAAMPGFSGRHSPVHLAHAALAQVAHQLVHQQAAQAAAAASRCAPGSRTRRAGCPGRTRRAPRRAGRRRRRRRRARRRRSSRGRSRSGCSAPARSAALRGARRRSAGACRPASPRRRRPAGAARRRGGSGAAADRPAARARRVSSSCAG